MLHRLKMADTREEDPSSEYRCRYVVSRLQAVDGSGLDVSNQLLCTSKLIHSLPPGAQHVHVPFSTQELLRWRDFLMKSDRGFSSCVAALKDEETLISATRAANAVLIDNSRKRSATCMEGMESRSMVELASQHVEELLSLHDLQPQLALSILRVNTHRLQKSEMLYFWLRRLPACCRHLIVAAVVEHSYLEVDNYKRVPDPAGFFRVMQESQASLKTLTINRATVDGRKVAACISPLLHLQCLELVSCYPPTVPQSLTSLTRLKLENAGHYCYNDRATSFTGDVSVFSFLEELELNCVHIPNFDRLASELSTLSSLSFLSFRYRNLRMSEAGVLMLALSDLPLQRLSLRSLPDPNHPSGFNDGDAWDILLSQASLTGVTQLDLAGSATESVMFVWDAMPQLQHVTLSDVDLRAPLLFGRSLVSPESLNHLHYLSAKHLNLTEQATVQLLTDLPVSLTALVLDGTCLFNSAAPALAALTNLQQLSFSQVPDPDGPSQPDAPRPCTFSPTGVHRAFSTLTALQSLDLHRCCMPEDCTAALIRALPQSMTRLDISKNQFPAAAARCLTSLTKLKSLKLGYKYESLTDEVALALAEHMTALCQLQDFSAEWHPSPQVSGYACLAMIRSLRALPHGNPSNAKYFQNSLDMWWPGVAAAAAVT